MKRLTMPVCHSDVHKMEKEQEQEGERERERERFRSTRFLGPKFTFSEPPAKVTVRPRAPRPWGTPTHPRPNPPLSFLMTALCLSSPPALQDERRTLREHPQHRPAHPGNVFQFHLFTCHLTCAVNIYIFYVLNPRF